MTDEGIKVVVDNGEIVDILHDIQSELSFEREYYEYQREQSEATASMMLCILVFVGACLGALIFRHLRK